MVESFLPKSQTLGLRHWCQVKSSPGMESIRAIMTRTSCKTFHIISNIKSKKKKKQLKEKLQSHGVWLFIPSVSHKGQTSPTCRVVTPKLFPSSYATNWGSTTEDCLTSSSAWLTRSSNVKMKAEQQTKTSAPFSRYFRVRRAPCSSAPWKRQMFSVASGYRRSIGLAIWR